MALFRIKFLRPFLFLMLLPPLLVAQPEDLSLELSALLEDSSVPAVAAAAVLGGEIISLSAAGLRKKGEAIAVTSADQFHIGSITKSMTATLGAVLIEEGVFAWNTTVSEVFPDVEIHPGFQAVTFEQLVTNTAGLPKHFPARLFSLLLKQKGSLEEQRMQLVRGMLQEAPTYPPGTDQVYSNAGFSIAGAMLERLMDQPFEALLTERLFEPLGMHSAGFRAPATGGQVDQPYGHARTFLGISPIDPEPRGDNPPGMAPAGAVHCSAADLARYALFHLGHMGEELLSKESLERLHRPADGRDYACGWAVAHREWAQGDTLSHTGSNTMFFAVIWIAPERDFAAVVLSNLGGPEAFELCDTVAGHLIREYLLEAQESEN